jgi:hypothetical protein
VRKKKPGYLKKVLFSDKVTLQTSGTVNRNSWLIRVPCLTDGVVLSVRVDIQAHEVQTVNCFAEKNKIVLKRVQVN